MNARPTRSTAYFSRSGLRRLAWAGWGAIALLVLHLVFRPIPMQSSTLDQVTGDEAIRRLRMGEVVLQVVDEQGQPVPFAQVHLRQTRHHFPFGGSLRTELFQDEGNAGLSERDRLQALELASTLFNATVPEDALKWYSTESTPGRVSYADADYILAWSEQHHLPMRGHHLFWEVERWNQPWLGQLSPTALRSAVQQRATEVCRRYRGRIAEYDVLNEMLNGDFFRRRLGEGIVNELFRWCHAADPTAQLYTNEYNILNGEQLDAYVALVRSLLDQGVPLGGIGIQAHIRQSNITPDQMQQALDRLAVFNVPLKLTEVSVVAATEADQAQMLTDLYRVAFAHPAVTGIMMWGFWEGSNWEPQSAIFRQNFAPTAAALAYQDLVFHQWWTDVTGLTDTDGRWTTRAFFGDYDLTVTVKGQSTAQPIRLLPTGSSQNIVIKLAL